ncbi:MAG: hypothetical protein WC758_07480 [Candidatus Woesearchaeota archaeon]|jgi:hypothetical protein
MNKECLNCERAVKENVKCFCNKCEKNLTFEEKQFLLKREFDNAVSSLGSLR